MDPNPPSLNPYAAPEGRVEDVLPEGVATPLAERSSRLAAAIVDTLTYAACFIPVLIIMWPVDFTDLRFVGISYAVGIPLLLVNLYFLHRDGQTLGKKVLRIKILRKDGSHASISRLLLLRILAPSLLGAIPILGVLFSLTNLLFIFGAPRRCLHDYMADTIVVQAA